MKKSIIWGLVFLLFILQTPVFPESVSANYSPASGVDINGTRGSNGVYYGAIQVKLSSGTEYSLDAGNNWINYNSPINLAPSKGYNLQYRSTGSSTFAELNFTVKLDKKPPLTTVQLSGEKNESDYYKGNVNITLNAIDYESGVKNIQYSLDSGQNWLDYSNSINLKNQEVSKFYYRSIDNSGNVEKNREVKILSDATPPNMPKIITNNLGWTKNSVSVILVDGMDNNSGVSKTEYKISETGSWIVYTTPFIIDKENQNVYARSIDNAGNISEITEQFIMIDRTAPKSPVIEISEDWNSEPVGIRINAAQDTEEFNPISYEFKLGSSEEWQEYIHAFYVDTIGETPVSFRSFDEAGNYSPAINKIAKFDNIIPTTVTSFTYTDLHYNQLTLHWSGATDNIGITNYDVYDEDDNFIKTSKGEGLYIDGLEANTKYTFKVVAVDAAYNESESSKMLQITTPTRPDFVRTSTNELFALRSDGTIWTWQYKDKETIANMKLQKVKGLSNVKKITAGSSFVIAQKVDGSVWAWGGFPVNSTTPKYITALSGTEQFFINNETIFATKKDGSFWTWGSKTYSKLNAPNDDVLIPTQMETMEPDVNIKQVGFGESHIVTLDQKGIVRTWGYNSNGQLGNGSFTKSFYPSQVKDPSTSNGFLNDVKQISVSGYTNYAIDQNNNIKSWGNGSRGELGSTYFYSDKTYTLNAQMVRKGKMNSVRTDLDNIVAIGSGTSTGFAVDNAGQMWSWGSKSEGILGVNSGEDLYAATDVINISSTKNKSNGRFINMGISSRYQLFLNDEGSLYGWGSNDGGQLGYPDSTKIVTPKIIKSQLDDVHARNKTVTAVAKDETFWIWGDDYPDYRSITPKQVLFGSEKDTVDPDIDIPAPKDIPTKPEYTQLINQTKNSASFQWGKSKSESQIAKYIIYRNGEEIATVTNVNYPSYEAINLEAGKTYLFTIKAVNKEGYSSELSDPFKVVVDKDIPSKPSGLEASDITMDSIQLKWNASTSQSKIAKYRIFMDGKEIGNSTETNYKVSNLNQSQSYTFTIDTINIADNGSVMSDALKVATLADIPTKPTIVEVSELTLHSAKLNWTASSSRADIEKYLIYVDGKEVASTVSTEYRLANLASNTIYKVNIYAVNKVNNKSLSSEMVSFYLEKDTPTRPTFLQTIETTSTTIGLKWMDSISPAKIKEYRIFVNDKEVGRSALSNYTIKGLSSDQSYNIVVSAINMEGYESERSEVVSLRTDKDRPTKPVNLKVQSKALHSVLINWDPSSSISTIKEYTVFMDGQELDKTSNTNYSVQGLKSGSNYEFTIQAVNSLGNISIISDPLKVTLEKDIPTAPLNIKSDKQTANSIQISWSPSTSQVAIAKYLVYVNDQEIGSSTNLQYLIEGLEPSKLYKVKVASVNQEGFISPFSSPQEIYTKQADIILNAPVNLQASNIDIFSVEVNWATVDKEDTIKGYNIYLNDAFYKFFTIKNIVLDNLVPSKNYKISIKAVSITDNESEASQPITFKTKTLSNFTTLDAGSGDHMSMVKADGSVWTWGRNHLYQLGIKGSTNKTTAVPVAITGVKMVRGEGSYTWAVKNDGSVWSWGNYQTPSVISGMTNVADLIAGKRYGENYILKTDGTVWTFMNTTPTKQTAKSINAVVGIAAKKDQVLALKNDGTVWDITNTTSIAITGLKDVRAVAASGGNSYVLKEDGTVWNWYGKDAPTQVNGLSDIQSISIGEGATIALKSDGTVWAWGSNSQGQIGNGTTSGNISPVTQVIGLKNVVQVSAGNNSVAVMKTDGTVWTWGNNQYGQLGDGTVTNRSVPVQVKENTAPQVELISPKGTVESPAIVSKTQPPISWKQTDSAEQTVFSHNQIQILDESGTVILDSGEIAQEGSDSSAPTNSWTPTKELPLQKKMQVRVKVKDEMVWSEWSTPTWFIIQPTVQKTMVDAGTGNHMAMVKADGSVWTWGRNYVLQLGVKGLTTNKTTAVPVAISGVKLVRGEGSYTWAVKNDGSVWSWGNYQPPAVVPGMTKVTDLIAGKRYTENYILKTDGTVWSFTNTTPTKLTQKSISSVIGIAVQKEQVLALKNDGMVWDITNTTPTAISSLKNIKAIAGSGYSSYALKEDGTVWTWSGKDTPTQLQGVSDIQSLSVGETASLALKSDGTVWNMGYKSSTKVPELNNIIQISAGPVSMAAVKEDGTVWTWGNNEYGQLGDGTVTNRSVPVQVRENTAPQVELISPKGTVESPAIVSKTQPPISWKQTDSAEQTVFSHNQIQILDESGTVILDSGEIAQEGSDSSAPTNSWTPTKELPLQKKMQVRVKVKDEMVWSEWSTPTWFIIQPAVQKTMVDAGTGNHMAMVKADGSVWTWGRNYVLQLGVKGLTTNKTTAVPVAISGVKLVRGEGSYTWAVKNDGSVWSWGNYEPPAVVPGMTKVTDLIAGKRYAENYILKTDGTVWSFTNTTPTKLTQKSISSVIGIAVQKEQVLALKNDGMVWDITNTTATAIAGLKNVKAIAGGYVLKEDGTVWSWSGKETPTQVNGLSDIQSLSIGESTFLALKSDGTVWQRGYNYSGIVPELNNVVQISAGLTSMAAVKADGTVWTWGNNEYGQLGDGTVTNRSVPVQMKENTAPKAELMSPKGTVESPAIVSKTQPPISWKQTDSAEQTVFSHNQIQILDESGAVILDSGEIAQEGSDNSAPTNSWTPTKELPLQKKMQVRVKVKDEMVWSEWSTPTWFLIQSMPQQTVVSNSIGSYMSLLKADGSVWSWGRNNTLQLGDGTYTDKTTAVPINITNVQKMRISDKTTWIIKKDGSLWYWGGYYYSNTQVTGITGVSDIEPSHINGMSYVLKKDGTLWSFNDTTGNMSSKAPTFVFNKINIGSVVALTARPEAILALKADGTVWNVTSSAKVSGIDNVTSMTSDNSYSYFLKTDGSVWSWKGTANPTLISGLIDIQSITAGNGVVAALKMDKTVWTWGSNSYGQLGNGTTTDRFIPAQVAGLNTVTQISAGDYNVSAVKVDGSVWTWGKNDYGQLGDGTTINRNLPVQVIFAK